MERNEANMAARYEHEIPEGYEARVEGNKVIIELKESEDERIRKQIEQALIEHDWSATYKVSKDDCLAYLEKLKELSKHGYGLYEYYSGGFLFIARPVKEVRDEEQQQEGSYNERIVNQLIGLVESTGGVVLIPTNKDELIAWLEKQKGQKSVEHFDLTKLIVPAKRPKEQKPAEWSEEDERNRDTLISVIKLYYNEYDLVRDDFPINARELCDWLKSLRSRPKTSNSWKPDEEQMKALSRCILIGNEDMIYALNSLCDDLKKLL